MLIPDNEREANLRQSLQTFTCCCEPLCGLSQKQFKVIMWTTLIVEVLFAIIACVSLGMLDKKNLEWCIVTSIALIVITFLVLYILKSLDLKMHPEGELVRTSSPSHHVQTVGYEHPEVAEEEKI